MYNIVLISTVLVAHNGFSFDFPILLAEVERRPDALSASSFETHRIHFIDTLPLLRQVSINNNNHVISNVCHF